MYLQRLEKTNIVGVPMADYWVKLAPYLLIGVGIHAMLALGAWRLSATLFAWYAYCLFVLIASSVALGIKAWRLQAPITVRPRFVRWFTGAYHFWISVVLSVGVICVYRSWWSFSLAVVWVFLAQIINVIIVSVINAVHTHVVLYRDGK